MVWLPEFGIFNGRTDFDACVCTRGGCADTVRESALEVDFGTGIPSRTWDSNLNKHCAGFADQH